MKAQDGQKFCPSCEKELSLTAFGKDKRRSDDLTVYCKKCRNQRQRTKYADSEELREHKRQYRSQWYAEHKEEQNARTQRYYREKSEDPEFVETDRGRGRRYDGSLRRKIVRKAWIAAGGWRKWYHRRMATDAEFRKKRRAYMVQSNQQRRALGSFPQEQWEQLLEDAGYRCLCCGTMENITCDHIVPVSQGGTNHLSNLQPLCDSCNKSKGARNQMDYRPKDLQVKYGVSP